MSKRKHISWKTRCASLIIQCGLIPYDAAKLMTEDQVLSLFHVDHNILHETGHEDRDKFWNLTHVYIKAHREKTKQDAKIIAKSRRILKKNALMRFGDDIARVGIGAIRAEWDAIESGDMKTATAFARRRLHSRGFDKTRKRKMDGTVVKR